VLKTTSIDRVSVAEQAYQTLRNAILTGEIAQGERIVELQIAKSLGISRAPVREATNRLLQEGLVESKTHFGPSVISMTPEKMRSLYDVRVAIEAVAIRQLARQASPGDIEVLEAVVQDMRKAATRRSLAGVVDSELRFHEVLRERSGNPYVIHVGKLLDAQVRLALTIDNMRYDNLRDVADEHLPLIDAIRRGDEQKAEKLLATHILGSLRRLPVSAPDQPELAGPRAKRAKKT
jgi:DNA-binding GntR family transcriptional regulator